MSQDRTALSAFRDIWKDKSGWVVLVVVCGIFGWQSLKLVENLYTTIADERTEKEKVIKRAERAEERNERLIEKMTDKDMLYVEDMRRAAETIRKKDSIINTFRK